MEYIFYLVPVFHLKQTPVSNAHIEQSLSNLTTMGYNST